MTLISVGLGPAGTLNAPIAQFTAQIHQPSPGSVLANSAHRASFSWRKLTEKFATRFLCVLCGVFIIKKVMEVYFVLFLAWEGLRSNFPPNGAGGLQASASGQVFNKSQKSFTEPEKLHNAGGFAGRDSMH